MNFDLPETSVALGAVFNDMRLASTAATSLEEHTSALTQIGFFNLAGPDAPDAANKHLNISIALTGAARAGMLAPLTETLMVREAHLQRSSNRPWTAAPTSLRRGTAALVPYGQVAANVLVASRGDGLELLPSNGRLASAPLQDRHTWQDVPTDYVAFDELAGPFCWRNEAAVVLGYCERMLDLTQPHVANRSVFGHPLTSFQAPRFRLSEVYWRIRGLRRLVLDAAWRADTGSETASVAAALAWLYAASVGRIVARHTHHVMGAIGFQDDMGLTRVSGALATRRLAIRASIPSRLVWQAWDRTSPNPSSTVMGALNPTGQAVEAVS
jgi:hypothetical protein